MSNNIPEPISGDECLVPGGARMVAAPSDGWKPKPKPPAVEDGQLWYVAALCLVFFLGFASALLAVGVTNRTAQRAPLYQPTLLEPPAIIVQPLRDSRADEEHQ